MLEVLIQSLRQSPFDFAEARKTNVLQRITKLQGGVDLRLPAVYFPGFLALLVNTQNIQVISNPKAAAGDSHQLATRISASCELNKPITPFWFGTDTLLGPATGCLVWQIGSKMDEVLFSPFGFDVSEAQSTTLSVWPTDRIVLKLGPGRLSSQGDDHLRAALWAATLNALVDTDLSAKTISLLENRLSIQRNPFLSRHTGRTTTPILTASLILRGIEWLANSGYITLGEIDPNAPLFAEDRKDDVAQGCGRPRGPISAEKYIPEHWVLGGAKNGLPCTDICSPEIIDDRHIRCGKCGRLRWRRKGSIHKPMSVTD